MDPVKDQAVVEGEDKSKSEGGQDDKTVIDRVNKWVDANKDDVNANKDNVDGAETFDYKRLEEIKDPESKTILMDAYKDMQRSFTKKFQTISDMTKDFKDIQSANSTWTPERLKAEMSKSDFIQAAQSIEHTQVQSRTSGLTEEEYSVLTDTEKAHLKEQNERIANLEAQLSDREKAQQDAELRDKYGDNYKPEAVDTITADLLEGRRKAGREDLFKVFDYGPAVDRAYALGVQDGQKGNLDKLNSSAVDGNTVVSSDSESVEKKEGETNHNYLTRIMHQHLSKRQKTQQAKT